VYFDFHHPSAQAYKENILGDQKLTATEISIKLYIAVRDDIIYNPYVYSFNPETVSASYCLTTKESLYILLGAKARYKGIPERLGLADVKNHLSSQK
jgi:hypothetical protein